jgi:magnesium-transporting ATPase (P-type)
MSNSFTSLGPISQLQEDAFSIGNAVDYADPELVRAVMEKVPEVIKFLMVMAMCNTVTPCKSAGGALFYKAQSQDEDALVQAAAQLQVLLCSKMGSVVGGYFLLHHNLLIAVVLLLWVYNV